MSDLVEQTGIIERGPAIDPVQLGGNRPPVAGDNTQDNPPSDPFPPRLRSRYFFDTKGDVTFVYVEATAPKPILIDRGGRLEIPTNNIDAIKAAIDTATHRGWDSLAVTGTDEFKRAVWLEASVAGLAVSGFKPSELDLQELARRLGPNVDNLPPGPGGGTIARTPANDPGTPPAPPSPPGVGELLEAGAARYLFKDTQSPSYFVRLRHPDGVEETLWGKRLEKALEAAGARVGDVVALRKGEAQPVEVASNIVDAEGKIVGRETVAARRNEWVAEILQRGPGLAASPVAPEAGPGAVASPVAEAAPGGKAVASPAPSPVAPVVPAPAPGPAVPEAVPETTARTNLSVPFNQRDAVKEAGGRWDAAGKTWYAPAGADLAAFAAWIKPEAAPGPAPVTVAAPAAGLSFADALQAAGLRLDGPPIMDGQRHYVPVNDDKPGQAKGWYVGHVDGPIPSGSFGNYREGTRQQWQGSEPLNLTAPERAQVAADMQRLKAERDAARVLAADKVAVDSRAALAAAVPADGHPYLVKKGLAADGLLMGAKGQTMPAIDREGNPYNARIEGKLLVPMRDVKGEVLSLQMIDREGTKMFPKNGRLAGLHVGFGAIGDATKPLIIAEGMATAKTLHDATGLPVVASFAAGNMKPVAEAFREAFPERHLILAGDNDHMKPPEKNVGRIKAAEAAEAVGGFAIQPIFRQDDKGTDWNDYAQIQGIEHTAGVLRREINDLNLDGFKQGIVFPKPGFSEAESFDYVLDSPLLFAASVSPDVQSAFAQLAVVNTVLVEGNVPDGERAQVIDQLRADLARDLAAGETIVPPVLRDGAGPGYAAAVQTLVREETALALMRTEAAITDDVSRAFARAIQDTDLARLPNAVPGRDLGYAAVKQGHDTNEPSHKITM